jgi:hypothetical protein
MGTGKRLYLPPFLVRQRHWGSIGDWHRRDPCLEPSQIVISYGVRMTVIPSVVQTKDWGRIYEMDI